MTTFNINCYNVVHITIPSFPIIQIVHNVWGDLEPFPLKIGHSLWWLALYTPTTKKHLFADSLNNLKNYGEGECKIMFRGQVVRKSIFFQQFLNIQSKR